MTSIEAMKYIDKTYIKYIDSIDGNGSYVDDVIHILNKVTNSKMYERGHNRDFATILKNNLSVWKWTPNDVVGGLLEVISLSQLLKNEILLYKLKLLEEGKLK